MRTIFCLARIISLGADAYLMKPFDKEELGVAEK
jgi:DNA-binding response OmpR family regulator